MSKALYLFTIFTLIVVANAAPTKNLKYWEKFVSTAKECPSTDGIRDPFLIHRSIACMFKKIGLRDEKDQYVEPNTRAEEVLITLGRNVDECARKATSNSLSDRKYSAFEGCVIIALSVLYDSWPTEQLSDREGNKLLGSGLN